jgi:hypothetical protein
LLVEQGFEAMAEAIQVLINEAMRIERANYFGLTPTGDLLSDRPILTDSSQKPSAAASASFSSKFPRPAFPSSIPRPWNAGNEAKKPSS